MVQNHGTVASAEATLTSGSFVSGKAKIVKIIVNDAEKHSFSQQKEQTVIPIICKRVVDSTSGETFTQINKLIGTPDSV